MRQRIAIDTRRLIGKVAILYEADQPEITAWCDSLLGREVTPGELSLLHHLERTAPIPPVKVRLPGIVDSAVALAMLLVCLAGCVASAKVAVRHEVPWQGAAVEWVGEIRR